MNTLVLLALILGVAATAANAFSEGILNQLFKLGSKRNIECTGDASVDMEVCIQPLRSLEHPAEIIDDVDTAEEIDAICQTLGDVRTCANNVHSQCGKDDLLSQVSSKTITGVATYMCTAENKQVLVEESECWKNKALVKNIERCITPSSTNTGNPCSPLVDFKDCVKGKVTHACNARAANYIDGLMYHALATVAEDVLGCEINPRITRSIWKMLPRSRK